MSLLPDTSTGNFNMRETGLDYSHTTGIHSGEESESPLDDGQGFDGTSGLPLDYPSSVLSTPLQTGPFLSEISPNEGDETPFLEDQIFNAERIVDSTGCQTPFPGDLSTWSDYKPKDVSKPKDSFFRDTIPFESIVADFEGIEMRVDVDIQANIERGFLVREGRWTCYRRNYFSVACSFSLCPSIYRVPLYICRSNYDRLLIQGFAMALSATVGDEPDDSQLLFQYDSSRSDKSKSKPKPRIQFGKATTVKGKTRNHQNDHQLVLDLYAKALDTTTQLSFWVLIARRPSEPIVVRGRSPKYYDDNEEDGKNGGREGGIKSSSEVIYPGPTDLGSQHWATAANPRDPIERGKCNEQKLEGHTLSSNDGLPAPEWLFLDSGNVDHDFLDELDTCWMQAMSKEWSDNMGDL
ncbi:hypothetical protein N7452_007656 [Penicillium brevicompactum]|uniref:NDT80 domain-containing protein n=1 Tax=Penicillium brevicompactum TaxID=5074 RepID=A0A9W9QFZ7_PENBR|nr:hypothetical protein N7452_007656 [Penicillium brevicompactum]